MSEKAPAFLSTYHSIQREYMQNPDCSWVMVWKQALHSILLLVNFIRYVVLKCSWFTYSY